MDKAILKKFAIESRQDLMDKIGSKIKYKTEREKLKNDLVWLVQSLGGICKVKEKITKQKNEKYMNSNKTL